MNDHSSETQAGRCSEWTAWHDRMPGSPATLHVTGQCVFPTDGYSVALKRAEPQGFNPEVLLLERVVQAPTGPVTQVETTEEVHYSEETEQRFTDVTILPDGGTIPVKETS